MIKYRTKWALICLFGILMSGTIEAQDFSDRYAFYHSKDEVYEMLQGFAQAYPDLVYTDTIGFSQENKYPIIALRISDNPGIDEDEPCVMYDGLHHAREPISMEVCLNLIEHLLTGYDVDDQITQWINETEIWIIPMINPEGWEYVVNANLVYPYWRKNLRDNNGNGQFDPTSDGVDINRNYDFNWIQGGSGNFGSLTYRGPEAFSEGEAQAKRDLALREKPLISLSYHTYGEIVIYSWSDSPEAPDQDLIRSIASGVASRIPSSTGYGTYEPTVSNCQNGFSRCWMYAVAGSLEYTVECAKEFIPDGAAGLEIAQQHIDGALFVLERVHGTGLQIYVKDAVSGEPIVATLKVPEIYMDILTPRTSDSIFGRFDRLLLPGDYNLEISSAGYITQLITNLQVVEDRKTTVEVWLEPESVSSKDILLASRGGNLLINKIYPNPFHDEFTMEYTLYENTPVQIILSDVTGRQVQYLLNERQTSGQHQFNWKTRTAVSNLQPGFYFISVQTKSSRLTKRILMNR
ncbi:MAG: T9SS type A sorting domain-containing protein [Bacteroidales bacterium]|nr:T9SS type A sorting domain-containing protein [Bacteroidales bacterium]